MHTIEIDGRPVAIRGSSRAEVEEFATEPAFKEGMLALEDGGGRPLWNGEGEFAPLVRDPSTDEVAAFERGFAAALADGDEPDRDNWLVLLVRVIDTIDGVRGT